MRVAHVGTYHKDSADGTEKTVAGLVTWLPDCGVQVEVWQPCHTTKAVSERVVDGVHIWDLPTYAGKQSYLRGVPAQTRRFVNGRQGQVQVAHLHSGFVADHVAIAALLQVPYVVAPNGAYSPPNLRGRQRWFKQTWMWLREANYVRRAALLHSVSERERNELRSMFPGTPVALVRNALDLPPVPSVDEIVEPVSRTRTFLFLGRLAVEQKGLDLLVRAYGRYLAQTGDSTTRLALVGPDYRGGRTELEQLIRGLGLSDRVELREAVFGAEKWRLLGSVLALAHPSRWDGLPFTVLEAMAARTPVLVTPGTNISELVSHSEAGVTVTADVDDVARGLQLLSQLGPTAQAHMGDNGYRLVQARFTWPEAARRMSEAYRCLTSRRREEQDESLAGVRTMAAGNPPCQ